METPLDLLDQLRRNLTPYQREMLNSIWSRYRTAEEWLLVRVLEHQFLGRLAPNDVRAELERLGGDTVYEIRDDHQRLHWGLTFLGILRTDEGPALEDLCLGYVEYVRELYLGDPYAELVSSQDVQTALSLSFEETQLLGRLLGFGRFCGSLRGGPGPEGWTAALPEDVATIATHPDRRRYLRTQALKDYQQNVPIDEHGRMSYYLRHTGLSGSQWEALQGPFTADLPPVEEAEVEPARLYVDDIDSFEKVKAVTREMVAPYLQNGYLPMPERGVKRAIAEILKIPFERSDWGGEANDISTANVQVNGRRRCTAFLLKGPGIGRKEMTIADCGKPGDQIVRLFSMAHDLFVVQYIGPIADAVARSVEVHVNELRSRGKRSQYVIIDGQDTARLLFAYGKLNAESLMPTAPDRSRSRKAPKV